MRMLTAVLLALMCVSCSKTDANQTSHDLKAAAKDIQHDPALKRLGQDMSHDAKDAGVQIRKDTSQVASDVNKTASGVKRSVDKTTSSDKSSSDNGSNG